MPFNAEVRDVSGNLLKAEGSNNIKIIALNTITPIMGTATGVLQNIVTQVVAYTVSAHTTAYLKKIVVSGTNHGLFTVKINGTPVESKRTYYTDFNTQFTFDGDSNQGVRLTAADVVQVNILHKQVASGDFEGTIYVREELN